MTTKSADRHEEDKMHSHDSNCIYSIAKSNGDFIEFSLSIAEQRVVGFIPAWSLAFLQVLWWLPVNLPNISAIIDHFEI